MGKRRDNNKTTVIAGAGLTGLMCALKLITDNPKAKIVIFDSAIHAGGMYSSLIYPNGAVFDHGMHVIYESCNPEVDELYRIVMPERDWNIYEHNEKDIAGLYYQGKLQTYSHFMDLRSFSRLKRDEFLASIIEATGVSESSENPNALDFLRNQFGNGVVEQVHSPLLERMYGVNPEMLHPFMIKATALNRVIIVDKGVALQLMEAPALRSRIAYPDQLRLPYIRENNQKALYPKKFGLKGFVDKLVQRLCSSGVTVHTSTTVKNISFSGTEIDRIELMTNTGLKIALEVDYLIWSAGLPSLAKSMGQTTSNFCFDKGPGSIYVNLLLDKLPDMERLYYFYCYDDNFATFRVTNYVNYCANAQSHLGVPLCVELWPSKAGLEKSKVSPDQAVALAVSELKQFGVINEHYKVLFSAVEKNSGDFPLVTLKNNANFELIRSQIKNLEMKNLINIGLMSDSGIFFLSDVLNHAFRELRNVSNT